MTQFSDLGLAEPLMKALAAAGYLRPTPIQAKAIPPILTGRDLLGAAQTGTGKTAAFALPLLHRLLDKPVRTVPRSVRALILSPTRELAAQIEASIRDYAKFTTIRSTVVYGGVPVGKQIRALSQPVEILVATPGRLLDLVDQRAVSLREIEVLILDEADQMLDLGFVHALRRIATLIPKQRQTLLFSATMPKAIREIASAYLTDPVEVAVTPVATTAEKVEQKVIHTEPGAKPALLAEVLRAPGLESAIVFTRTKHGADRVVRQLEQAGIQAAAIHGNKSQGQRERALGSFRDGDLKILVATDIAARGIDVDGISHIVNFDLPNVPETYVHRIGRTARAGAAGVAIAFCTPEERGDLAAIEKLTRIALTPVGAVPAWDGRIPKKPAPQGRQPRGDRQGPARGDRRPASAGAKPAGAKPQREERRSVRDEPRRAESPGRSGESRRAAPAASAKGGEADGRRAADTRTASEGLGGVAFLQQRADQRRAPAAPGAARTSARPAGRQRT